MKALPSFALMTACISLALVAAKPAAAHQTGAGIGLGYAWSRMSADLQSGGGTSYQGKGASFMLESNQIFFGQSWSLIPVVAEFTAETFEGGEGALTSDRKLGGHAMGSTEIRYWFPAQEDVGDVFAGIQLVWAILERISKGLDDPTRKETEKPNGPYEPVDLRSQYGYGLGLVGGLELQGGFFVKLHYTWARFKYDTVLEGREETMDSGLSHVEFRADVDFTSVRIYTGYRF